VGLQSTAAYFNLDSVGAAFQHPIELDRNQLKALYRRSGRMRVEDLVLAPTGVNQQLSISAGRAFMLGTETAQQGGYFAWSDASSNVTFAVPSASPRIDTLLLRIYDNQYGTITGNPRPQYDIVQGTPGASPAVHPDSDFNTGGPQWVPGAWYRLGDVRINPGDTVIPTNQIYTNTTYVKSPGGVTVCNSANNTTGFGGRPTDAINGDEIWEQDTGRRYMRAATTGMWLPSGLQAMASTSSNGTASSATTATRDAVLGSAVFQVPSEWASTMTYEVGAYFSGGGDTSGDWFGFTIRDGGASTPTGASPVIAWGDLHPKVTNPTSSQEMMIVLAHNVAFSAGTHTLGLFTQRLTGTGIATPNSPSSGVHFLWVKNEYY
jgi:hypothetical protein